MIFLSLRKTKKWGGSCDYDTMEGKIYLPIINEVSNNLLEFNVQFWYAHHHECLHLLLKKLGIRGFRNEEKISRIAERLLISTIRLIFLFGEEDLESA